MRSDSRISILNPIKEALQTVDNLTNHTAQDEYDIWGYMASEPEVYASFRHLAITGTLASSYSSPLVLDHLAAYASDPTTQLTVDGVITSKVEQDGTYFVIDPQSGELVGPFSSVSEAEAGVRDILDQHYNYDESDDVTLNEVEDLPPSEPPPYYEDPSILEQLQEALEDAGVTDIDPYVPDAP